MIGLDTNVVARFILQDDAAQSAIASRLLESFSRENPGFIPLVCVIELVWVLRSTRRAASLEIKDVLETLLRIDSLVVERADVVWQALRQFAKTNADFADCLIERISHASGCDYTATFDRTAVSVGMKLLS